MDVRPDNGVSGPQIVGFVGRGFRVRVQGNDHVSPGGIIITPRIVEEWSVLTADALDLTDIDHILPASFLPEFLLLGTGPNLVRPSRAFVRAVEKRGIGVEAMDSRAAARTWNVLRAEDRAVTGALMPL